MHLSWFDRKGTCFDVMPGAVLWPEWKGGTKVSSDFLPHGVY